MANPKKRIESHRDLQVWQESMNLAVAAYDLTEVPKGRAIRIDGTNTSLRHPFLQIAEGYGRESSGA